MLEELDRAAKEVEHQSPGCDQNAHPQALDQQYLAREHRRSGRA